MSKFSFINHLAALRPTLGHWQGGNLTYPMLITALFQARAEGHWEPCNEFGSQSRTPSDYECNILSHSVALKKIGHRLASLLHRFK